MLKLFLLAVLALLAPLEGGGVMIAAPQIFLAGRKRGNALPAGLTRVEWLESNGSPFIRVGLEVVNHVGWQVETVYRYPIKPSGETWLFGAWGRDAVGNWASYLIGMINGFYQIGAGPDTATYRARIPWDSSFHVVKMLTSGLYIDDVRGGPSVGGDSNLRNLPNINIPLGSAHASGRSIRQFGYCKMWDLEDNLVRDMVPCSDEDGVGCMYDFVTEARFYNVGSGIFGLGPPI